MVLAMPSPDRSYSKLLYVSVLIFLCLSLGSLQAQVVQIPISAVNRMAQIPAPLNIRDWSKVGQEYYLRVLNPLAKGDDFPVVNIDPSKPGFRIKSYLGSDFRDEAFTCLSAVIGAKLVGLNPRLLFGVDYVKLTNAWYDAKHGIYRHNIGDTNPVLNADIYGYWAAIQGLMLSAQYPDDTELSAHAQSTVEAFRAIAHGLGCPSSPNYHVLGWDFRTNQPAGRDEPMNRIGNAPSVAWVLLIGSQLKGGDDDLISCSRSTMQWYVDNPGRYEMSHCMGPLVAARLNALGGDEQLDLSKILDAWFGDGDQANFPWGITSGTKLNGLTCDGLDGAKWPNHGFYAFTMGSLQGPAWLVPVVRYQPKYARAIARYALNAANSARLLEGCDLDSEHQDHGEWKANFDPDNLLFYEGLASSDPGPEHRDQPYARGDPVLLGWGTGRGPIAPQQYSTFRNTWFGDKAYNISLYMGNHVGFLGGIFNATDIQGILCWDCIATDWFHPPAYPTRLIYNPFPETETPTIQLGDDLIDIYDACQGKLIATSVSGKYNLTLLPDSAAVLVYIPVGKKLVRDKSRLLAGNVVVDWNYQQSP